jgi:hypothetical protein
MELASSNYPTNLIKREHDITRGQSDITRSDNTNSAIHKTISSQEYRTHNEEENDGTILE